MPNDSPVPPEDHEDDLAYLLTPAELSLARSIGLTKIDQLTVDFLKRKTDLDNTEAFKRAAGPRGRALSVETGPVVTAPSVTAPSVAGSQSDALPSFHQACGERRSTSFTTRSTQSTLFPIGENTSYADPANSTTPSTSFFSPSGKLRKKFGNILAPVYSSSSENNNAASLAFAQPERVHEMGKNKKRSQQREREQLVPFTEPEPADEGMDILDALKTDPGKLVLSQQTTKFPDELDFGDDEDELKGDGDELMTLGQAIHATETFYRSGKIEISETVHLPKKEGAAVEAGAGKAATGPTTPAKNNKPSLKSKLSLSSLTNALSGKNPNPSQIADALMAMSIPDPVRSDGTPYPDENDPVDSMSNETLKQQNIHLSVSLQTAQQELTLLKAAFHAKDAEVLDAMSIATERWRIMMEQYQIVGWQKKELAVVTNQVKQAVGAEKWKQDAIEALKEQLAAEVAVKEDLIVRLQALSDEFALFKVNGYMTTETDLVRLLRQHVIANDGRIDVDTLLHEYEIQRGSPMLSLEDIHRDYRALLDSQVLPNIRRNYVSQGAQTCRPPMTPQLRAELDAYWAKEKQSKLSLIQQIRDIKLDTDLLALAIEQWADLRLKPSFPAQAAVKAAIAEHEKVWRLQHALVVRQLEEIEVRCCNVVLDIEGEKEVVCIEDLLERVQGVDSKLKMAMVDAKMRTSIIRSHDVTEEMAQYQKK